jgi:hypothetical protein
MIRFIPYAGEAFAGEYVDTPCSLCGDLICDCDDDYRDPEALRAWMRLTEDERQSRLAEAHAKIAAAFNTKVERDLRFTIELQRKDAA